MIEVKVNETTREGWDNRIHFAALAEALQKDPEFAWTWHCNIVEANMLGGYLKWKEANEAACRVMKSLFDVDTTSNFIKLLKTRAPTKALNV